MAMDQHIRAELVSDAIHGRAERRERGESIMPAEALITTIQHLLCLWEGTEDWQRARQELEEMQ